MSKKKYLFLDYGTKSNDRVVSIILYTVILSPKTVIKLFFINQFPNVQFSFITSLFTRSKFANRPLFFILIGSFNYCVIMHKSSAVTESAVSIEKVLLKGSFNQELMSAAADFLVKILIS